LNGWTKNKGFVQGRAIASMDLGIGVIILRKTPIDESPMETLENSGDLLTALACVHRVSSQMTNTFDLIRGIKVFDGDSLYLVKPLGQRFWTQTTALNDADEIAGTILMGGVPQEVA
jgi:hypothetical protein